MSWTHCGRMRHARHTTTCCNQHVCANTLRWNANRYKTCEPGGHTSTSTSTSTKTLTLTQHVSFNWFLFGSDFSITTIAASWCCTLHIPYLNNLLFFIHSHSQWIQKQKILIVACAIACLFKHKIFHDCVAILWRFSMCRFFSVSLFFARMLISSRVAVTNIVNYTIKSVW